MSYETSMGLTSRSNAKKSNSRSYLATIQQPEHETIGCRPGDCEHSWKGEHKFEV